MANPYDILVVEPSASQEEIQRAYRVAILELHPDKKAKKPVVLVDACAIRFGVTKETLELVEKTGMVSASNLEECEG